MLDLVQEVSALSFSPLMLSLLQFYWLNFQGYCNTTVSVFESELSSSLRGFCCQRSTSHHIHTKEFTPEVLFPCWAPCHHMTSGPWALNRLVMDGDLCDGHNSTDLQWLWRTLEFTLPLAHKASHASPQKDNSFSEHFPYCHKCWKGCLNER